MIRAGEKCRSAPPCRNDTHVYVTRSRTIRAPPPPARMRACCMPAGRPVEGHFEPLSSRVQKRGHDRQLTAVSRVCECGGEHDARRSSRELRGLS